MEGCCWKKLSRKEAEETEDAEEVEEVESGMLPLSMVVWMVESDEGPRPRIPLVPNVFCSDETSTTAHPMVIIDILQSFYVSLTVGLLWYDTSIELDISHFDPSSGSTDIVLHFNPGVGFVSTGHGALDP
jgi:hypothetical protein